MQFKRSNVRVSRGRLVAALACAPVCALSAGVTSALVAGTASAATASGSVAPAKQLAAATTEACVNAEQQSERSATFVGEMNAVPGTARMLMRVEILEHTAGEAGFRTVTYPGIGAWLRSSPGVKTYKSLDKVTDLFAPAVYRAVIHFRWLNAHGHAIKFLDLRTPRCVQTAESGPETAPATTSSAGSVSF